MAPSFVAFAGQIDAAVAAGDLDFFRERAETTERVCTDADLAVASRAAVCGQAGERFDGLGLSYWRSDESGTVPLEEVVGVIGVLVEATVEGAADEWGDAEATVFALGAQHRIELVMAAVLTAIVDPSTVVGASEPLRVSVVTFWAERDNEWRLTEVMQAFVLGEEFLSPDGVGGGQLRSWQRFESSGEVDGAGASVEVLADELTVFAAPGLGFVPLGTLGAGDAVTVLGVWDDDEGRRWLGLDGLGWLLDEPGQLSAPGLLEELPLMRSFDARAASPPHPPTVRSGIPEVDAVIDAVIDRDRERLMSMVEVTAESCSTDRDARQQQCPPGVEDGTVLERFDIAVCAGESPLVANLPAFVDALFDPADQGYGARETDVDEPLFVYAVAELPASSVAREVDGPYVLYLTYGQGTPTRQLNVSETGEINRLSFGCGGAPAGFSVPSSYRLIVRPYAPPPLEALSDT